MKITIIGVVPPCPRCERMYNLTAEAASELGIAVELYKISYDSEEAKRYGKVGTAHDIAEWANLDIDWGKIRDIICEGWSKELDDFLMPCALQAKENGWLMSPVLVIDDEVEHMGYVPDKEIIKTAILKRI
jgi:hypothetical protein